MIIRYAKTEDLETVVAIEADNFSVGEAMPREVFQERIKNTWDTFLVAELDGQVAGYMEGAVIEGERLSDELFQTSKPNPAISGYIAITSLSIARSFKGQGIGTALIAAMKDLAVAKGHKGITLTCHDYLIAFYELNGFEDMGQSASQLGGGTWFDMLWKNPDRY